MDKDEQKSLLRSTLLLVRAALVNVLPLLFPITPYKRSTYLWK